MLLKQHSEEQATDNGQATVQLLILLYYRRKKMHCFLL